MEMLLFLAVALVVAAPAADAASHTVGGDSGWDTGVSYTEWAAGETFTVGDTLEFNYLTNHAVDQVSATDYASCATGSPLKSYRGGKTTVTLSTAGAWYFICPTSNHCSSGQALSVTVEAATTPPPPGVTASPPPPGAATSPPPPVGSATSPPPPPAGSGAGSLVGNRLSSSLIGAVLVVLMGLI
uniref:Phytocyanin domain-containing protein n=1 Tax=Kalanchoe fedtschenkoi TaxID=63787 RepID=A0A7N0V5B0_KALFE